MNDKSDIVTSAKPWLDAELSKNELAQAFGKSVGAVNYWAGAKGLPQTATGKFNLRQSLLWLEQHYRQSKMRTIGGTGLTEQDLSRLFDVTRQTVWGWRKSGLPRAENGTYSLRQVCCWLRAFYRHEAQAEYQIRIETMRKKTIRNCRQLERFLAGEK
jgi:phage terminase Nu1 subunit (DNA packaging protein)